MVDWTAVAAAAQAAVSVFALLAALATFISGRFRGWVRSALGITDLRQRVEAFKEETREQHEEVATKVDETRADLHSVEGKLDTMGTGMVALGYAANGDEEEVDIQALREAVGRDDERPADLMDGDFRRGGESDPFGNE